jgi:hypothetical protein
MKNKKLSIAKVAAKYRVASGMEPISVHFFFYIYLGLW